MYLELDRPNFREQRPETLVTITDEVRDVCAPLRKDTYAIPSGLEGMYGDTEV